MAQPKPDVTLLYSEGFRTACLTRPYGVDTEGARRRLGALRAAIDAASGARRSPVTRILGDRGDARRLRRVSEAAADLRDTAEVLGLASVTRDIAERTLDGWRAVHTALEERLGWAERIAAYRAALDRLRFASLETPRAARSSCGSPG